MDDDMIKKLNSKKEEIIKSHQKNSNKSNQMIYQFLEKSNLTEEDIKKCESVTPLSYFNDSPFEDEDDIPF